MCGIFGVLAQQPIDPRDFSMLASRSERRGKDSSGLLYFAVGGYRVIRADYRIRRLIKQVDMRDVSLVMGHSRLITNGQSDNQPVVRGGRAVIHNGIVTNDTEYGPIRLGAVCSQSILK